MRSVRFTFAGAQVAAVAHAAVIGAEFDASPSA
jgi:hypothetical protein